MGPRTPSPSSLTRRFRAQVEVIRFPISVGVLSMSSRPEISSLDEATVVELRESLVKPPPMVLLEVRVASWGRRAWVQGANG